MKFDAYWATFWGDSGFFLGEPCELLFEAVCVEFAKRLGADIEQPPHKLPGGYSEAFQLVREGEVICYFLTGGTGAASGSHGIRVQGSPSPEVADLIRELVPHHGISRVDVADDFCEEGIFDKLVSMAEAVALKHRVELRREGAGWYEHQRDKGRTLYVGSRQSAVFMRIYERGKKLLAEGQQADPNYVRVEIEVKPGSKAKRLLAHSSPQSFFGASNWTKELAEMFSGEEMDRIRVGTVWRRPELDRTIQAIAKQYGKKLLELRDTTGSADEVFRIIEEAMLGVRQVKQALRQVKQNQAVESVELW